MNICILYHGQLRTFDRVVNNQKYNLFDNTIQNKYHVLYTTWNTENCESFKKVYPKSYIRQTNPPNRTDMFWDDKFKPHEGNPQYKGDVFPYFCQLTIWKEACKTIYEYEKLNNFKFDIIIRLRPDTLIIKNIDNKTNFYNINSNTIYVPTENRFDVYKTGSVPDQIAWGDRNTIIKILNGLDIADKIQQDKYVFHPETSLYNMIKYYNINLKYCDFQTDILL